MFFGPKYRPGLLNRVSPYRLGLLSIAVCLGTGAIYNTWVPRTTAMILPEVKLRKIRLKIPILKSRFSLLKSTWERWTIIKICQAWIEIQLWKIYFQPSLFFNELEAEKGKIVAVLCGTPIIAGNKIELKGKIIAVVCGTLKNFMSDFRQLLSSYWH